MDNGAPRPGQPDHVYLSDFGLTKGVLSSAALTGTGHFLGTVDYSAPEQIEGRKVDARTDEYALVPPAGSQAAGCLRTGTTARRSSSGTARRKAT